MYVFLLVSIVDGLRDLHQLELKQTLKMYVCKVSMCVSIKCMYVCVCVCHRCGEGGPLLEHLLGVVDVEVDDAHLVAALLGGDERVDLLQKLVILLPGRFK